MLNTIRNDYDLFSIADGLIPAEIISSEDQSKANRARVLLVVIAVSSVLGVIASLFYCASGSYSRALFTGSAFVPFFGAILVLRKTVRVDCAAHYLCVLFTLSVLLSPLLSPTSVPLMAGLISIPLAATAVGGPRIGFFWTGIVMSLLSASALWHPFLPDEREVAWNLVFLAGGCGIALAAADFSRERALREAMAAREQANHLLVLSQRTERALLDSQSTFSAAFRGAPASLVLSEVESGKVLDVNESFARAMEFERNDVVGRRLADLGIWPGDEVNEDWRIAMMTKDPVRNVELCLRNRSGQEVWFLTSAEEIEIEGRLCSLAQGIEITTRKRLDDELEEHRKVLEFKFAERGRQLRASQLQLQEKERLAAVGTLAAGIAHQINNPIGGIIAASEFALTEGDGVEGDRARRSALETALVEARRCGRIVKSVLKFARDEPTPKWVEDLDVTVRRAGELSRGYVKEKDGQLEINVSSELLPVLISPIDIEQVVLNLIRNAAESRQKGVRVVLETRRRGDQAELVVSDNGCGIEHQERSRVFDPFYTTRLENGGSGLGLSVVHGVVGDHGGKVEIERTDGGGTQVRISLPIRPKPENEDVMQRLRA